MISRKVFALFFLSILCFQTASAQELSRSTESALAWLTKMGNAPRQYNYAGTFVYYADSHMETSYIAHKRDAFGERERIEVLDGMPRIVFRNNDEMKCYLPESRKIYTEKRWFRKFFPDFMPQPVENIDDNYLVTEIKRERIANREAQVLMLIPRDSLRYGHQFWIDVDTGLLLKVSVVQGNDIIEQFSFAQLRVDHDIEVGEVTPDQAMVSGEWKTTNLIAAILNKNELRWEITHLPTGFKKLVEMKRNLTEKATLVDHIALSDGLATVSVFIESIVKDAPAPVPGFFSSRGAINIYVRTLDGNKITTVGEVPVETIKLIGDSVIRKN
jgi:sigma-E factor negative regulatory protein RseB